MEGPSHDKATGDKSNGLKWASSVAWALGQLLAWSLDAKAAALDAGLLPAILQELDALKGTNLVLSSVLICDCRDAIDLILFACRHNTGPAFCSRGSSLKQTDGLCRHLLKPSFAQKFAVPF